MPTVTQTSNIPELGQINNLGPATTFPGSKPTDFFSYCVGDVISMMARPMSLLMNWIPSSRSTEMVRTAGHLSWVAAKDFDGSTSYLEYISIDDPIGMCDFGSGAMQYNICEFKHEAKRISLSNKDEPLNFFSAGGINYCDKQPRVYVRGEMAGLRIENDAEWVLSGLTSRLTTHLKWNMIHGMDALIADPGSYDGLKAVITKNWVKNHRNGEGSCVWTDPLVVSGTDIDNVDQLIRRLRFYLRKIIKRMTDRGYTPTSDDICITGPLPFFNMIWDYMATGALANVSNQTVVDFEITPEVWQRERQRLTSGGLGYGVFPLPEGFQCPVIPEDQLGRFALSAEGNAAVTGDIMILTRYFDGNTVLLHEWIDLSAAKGLPVQTNYTFAQDGMVRVVWVTVNESCYWYGQEMYARFMSLMQPLQFRLTDVTLETGGEYDMESPDYTHQNFYPYEGEVGGQGTALLVPFN